MRRVRETVKVSDLSDTDTGLSRIGRSTCLGHGTQIERNALASSGFERYWWEERRGSKRTDDTNQSAQSAGGARSRHSPLSEGKTTDRTRSDIPAGRAKEIQLSVFGSWNRLERQRQAQQRPSAQRSCRSLKRAGPTPLSLAPNLHRLSPSHLLSSPDSPGMADYDPLEPMLDLTRRLPPSEIETTLSSLCALPPCSPSS